MDILTLLLIAVIVVAVLALAFAITRKKQRSGGVLAAPDSPGRDGVRR